jgi:hypothetical protein
MWVWYAMIPFFILTPAIIGMIIGIRMRKEKMVRGLRKAKLNRPLGL